MICVSWVWFWWINHCSLVVVVRLGVFNLMWILCLTLGGLRVKFRCFAWGALRIAGLVEFGLVVSPVVGVFIFGVAGIAILVWQLEVCLVWMLCCCFGILCY